ncbi:MAG TPA: integrase arm-type DNA-binding domain-containing protein [Thiolinea sp.]|nr:integrase arm-type DNA-binding domain-containing protein [Thiolinea sp.]
MNRKLTDSKVKHFKHKPDGRPAFYSDGGGLFLMVDSLKKCWRYNYRMDGRQKTLSIGTYPETSLQEARRKHEEARALLARGVDPSSHKRRMKASRVDLTSTSFQVTADEWFQRSVPGWSESHITRTRRYLEKDIYPWIGALNINEVTPGDIISIVKRVADRGAEDVARRVKQYILQVYKYAVTMELANRNPAADIDNNIILRPRAKRHFATITDPVKVGQLMRDMDTYQGSFVVRCALRLSSLVMLRPGELRAAEWTEIDLDTATWTIPIKRMKAPTHIKQANQSVHIVPLSRQAVAILEELQPFTGHFRYVFPSARGASRPLSDNGLRVALRTMGYDNDTMTPHGFRGMASSLLNQMGRFNPDAIERQLAHKDKDPIRAAYNRAEYLDERREMLQAWADYLDQLREGGQVITFRTSNRP